MDKREVKKQIGQRVKCVCEKMGRDASEVEMDVEFDEEIIVWINTEKPFMGNEFFLFIQELKEEMKNIDSLSDIGSTDYVYDWACFACSAK